jgi:enhancing lycopene biosynthesis protein 2
MHVIDHYRGDEMNGTRNVLVEAARIARGNIKDLREARVEDFDALILPGGFGVAKNLSDFAVSGANCTVQPDVLAVTQAFAQAGKPIGLICIAPALAAKIFGAGVHCTIGNDADTAAAMEKMGARHQDCPVEDIVIDQRHKLVTTPAYMLARSISEAATGINKLVDEVLILAEA